MRVEVAQQNNGCPCQSTHTRDQKKVQCSILLSGPEAKVKVRDLSLTCRHRDTTFLFTCGKLPHIVAELEGDKQTHNSPPSLPVGNTRKIESQASPMELSSRAKAVC